MSLYSPMWREGIPESLLMLDMHSRISREQPREPMIWFWLVVKLGCGCAYDLRFYSRAEHSGR